VNSGDVTLNTEESGTFALGIRTRSFGDDSPISIENSGNISVSADETAFGIRAEAFGVDGPITIENSGDISATSLGGGAAGISAVTLCCYSAIAITNSGNIAVDARGDARGIDAQGIAVFSDVGIKNSGAITASAKYFAYGIYTETNQTDSDISISNSGAVNVSASSGSASGIRARTYGEQSSIAIENSGPISVTDSNEGIGIFAVTDFCDAPISLVNSGDIMVVADFNARGIFAASSGPASPIAIYNTGAITALAYVYEVGDGISARSAGIGSDIAIANKGTVIASTYAIDAFSLSSNIAITNSGPLYGGVDGIFATGVYGNIAIVNEASITAASHGIHVGDCEGPFLCLLGDAAIVNTGSISAGQVGILAITFANDGSHPYVPIGDGGSIYVLNQGTVAGNFAGIAATVAGNNSTLSIVNEGTVEGGATGIFAATGLETFIPCGCYYGPPIFNPSGYGNNSPISIVNTGDIEADQRGIYALTYGAGSPISIANSGSVTSAGPYSAAIIGITQGDGSNVVIDNSGTVRGLGAGGLGIFAIATGAGSTNLITNSGSVYGGFAGIRAISFAGTTIVNSGDISAGSSLAIFTYGAPTTIYNSGHVTGYVALTNSDDAFINQSHGVFETKLVSDFGAGDDLFRNEQGGTVLAASNAKAIESSSFVGLERFENAGLISLQDGQPGDSFEISNTVGARDLSFVASSGSTLAIDAFLGGPGSTADNLIINGDTSGKTELKVNNTNTGPGTFAQAIPVIYANGNVSSDAFFLNQPIDTGFFNYDLFFRPTGSGVFELRSFLGAGAFVLPQLETAAQDIWHEGSDTWFDRSTDLRVLLNGGGAAPLAYGPDGAPGAAPAGNMTPAVWARG
jgi:autotransporter family porin